MNRYYYVIIGFFFHLGELSNAVEGISYVFGVLHVSSSIFLAFKKNYISSSGCVVVRHEINYSHFFVSRMKLQTSR